MGEAKRRKNFDLQRRDDEIIERSTQYGYSIVGPNGAFHFQNVSKRNEIVLIDGIGYINVTKALSLVQTSARPYVIPFDQQTIHHISLRDIDERVIAEMTTKRLEEPTLFVDIRGRKYLLDGAHRLNARHRRGLKSFRCFVLIEEALDHCRVCITRELSNGTRVPVRIDTNEFIEALSKFESARG